MRKSTIKVDQKRGRGRPATGRDPMVSSRIPAEIVDEIDQWADENETTRSDAIRQLVEKALADRGGRRTAKKASR
jgi:Arc/MetJ-type ribon-helix-helix transcriptional regulator